MRTTAVYRNIIFSFPENKITSNCLMICWRSVLDPTKRYGHTESKWENQSSSHLIETWTRQNVFMCKVRVWKKYCQTTSARAANNSDWFRSGVGANAGPARCRVQLATVFLRPPSGQRPGRRRAHPAHVLRTCFRLAITEPDATPVMPHILQTGLRLAFAKADENTVMLISIARLLWARTMTAWEWNV